ncbi:MAG: polyphosphate kinase 2 [Alphaproteobacteria bacterium]|nr:polyphosphate kinase 2 [Alphaproteobacteria bacterium]
MDKKTYKATLEALQIELVKFQRHVIADGLRVLVLLEGRDAAGKDGVIKRIVEHMSPRDTRVVALGVPSDRERKSWYYQRYVEEFPAEGEIALFNRSWYNRAGVERVMGYATEEEQRLFMETVADFERIVVHGGVSLIKYYLDISREEQAERLGERRDDPLKQWKNSPVDAQAQDLWDEYSAARDAMLVSTHRPAAPWTIVKTDDKRTARINLIRDLLSRFEYDGRDGSLLDADPDVVFRYDQVADGKAELSK